MTVVKKVAGAGVLGAWIAGATALSVVAQTPPPNTPPPTGGPALANVRHDSPPMAPPLLAAEPSHEAVVNWLTRNVPASRGRTAYVNGDEAFWIEHQDIDPKNDMKITATIHVENFGDPDSEWRSSYQVTQFDCENQQQLHLYLTQYPGNNLSGEVKKDSPLIKRSEFVGPTTIDFAHLRAVCLAAYDQSRQRPYTIEIPAR